MDQIPLATTVFSPNGACFFTNENDAAVKELISSHNSRFGVGILFVRVGTLDLGGSFVVPRRINIIVLFSGATIDFSRATFVHKHTKITILAVCAGAKFKFPPGVNVDYGYSVGVCGGFGNDKRSQSPDFADILVGPKVSVQGLGVCGGASGEVNVSVPRIAIMDSSTSLSTF